MWQHIKLSDFSLGAHPRDSPIADEDVKKPNQQEIGLNYKKNEIESNQNFSSKSIPVL